MYGGETARWIWECHPAPLVENLLSETYELRRDPKEKETEKATKALKEWMGENQETVNSLMSFDN